MTRVSKRLSAATIAVLLGVLIAGCGGNDSDFTGLGPWATGAVQADGTPAVPGPFGRATKAEVCDLNSRVSSIFTGSVNVINDRTPEQLDDVAALGRAAQRYPEDAVQYEGKQLEEAATDMRFVGIDAYMSKQNIRALCER